MMCSSNQSFQVASHSRLTDFIIPRLNAKSTEATINALGTASAATVSFDWWMSSEAQDVLSVVDYACSFEKFLEVYHLSLGRMERN